MRRKSRHFPSRAQTLRPREFWRRFGTVEHERLEFKRSPLHVQAAIAAMAMARGGVIVLGVTDDRRLAGCPLDQDTVDRIAAAAHAVDVDVETRALRVGAVALTLIVVPEVRDRVVTMPDGRLLRRLGSANVPLRGDAVARFVREREAVRALASRAA